MDARTRAPDPMAIVVMGPAGAGKTTTGKRLADVLGWAFIEGDDLHPAANIAKMHRGVPLTDEDRLPWLDELRRHIERHFAQHRSVVVACSALRRRYRARLCVDRKRVRFVYLKATPGLLRERIKHRKGHFLPASLLDSQLQTLEEPQAVLTVDAALPLDVSVNRIRAALGLTRGMTIGSGTPGSARPP